MANISIIKSSSDLDNKELFPVSCSSYPKVWSLSDSENEYEEKIDTDDSDSSDSDMLERLSYLVCILWKKRKLHIKTDLAVTGWLLCVIPHFRKDAKYHLESDNRKNVNNVITIVFMDDLN